MSHPDKAEVVDPGGQDGRLGRHLAVVWHRSRHVGGEHDAVLLGFCGEVLQRMEDLDIRVYVEDRSEAPAEQGSQEPRLHRRGEFHYRIGSRHFVQVGALDVEVGEAEYLERLMGRVDLAQWVVEHQHEETPPGVVRQEARGQDVGRRKVVTGDDGAGQISAWPFFERSLGTYQS